jgi:hypothetical protein
VRQLTTYDLVEVEHHLLSLGLPDRRARFGGNRGDEVIRAYVRQLDPFRVILVGAFDPSSRLVGVAEAHQANITAEIGVSIEAEFRNFVPPGAAGFPPAGIPSTRLGRSGLRRKRALHRAFRMSSGTGLLDYWDPRWFKTGRKPEHRQFKQK